MAQEEMQRRQGFWWSPDSRALAFVEVDETQVPRFTIPHPAESAGSGSASRPPGEAAALSDERSEEFAAAPMARAAEPMRVARAQSELRDAPPVRDS